MRTYRSAAMSLCVLTLTAACGAEDGSTTEFAGARFAIEQSVEATEPVRCWLSADWDLDDDGYAMDGADLAARVDLNVTRRERLSCPVGYVAKRGDCDDTNPSIHPRRREAAANSVDDDCDGSVDEPEFYYPSAAWNDRSDGFSMIVTLNTPGVAAHAADRALYHEIEYRRLDQATAPTVLARRPTTSVVTSMFGVSVDPFANIALDGLRASSVYGARVRFHRKHRAGFTVISPWSDWYYTVTSGRGRLTEARQTIAMQGLQAYGAEHYDAATGYRGAAPDGTAFAALPGDWWCSEFYSWATGAATRIGVRRTTSDLQTFFVANLALQTAPASGFEDRTWRDLRLGDWLGVDTDADGAINHSAMFLGYQSGTGTLTTLDGNAANQIKVRDTATSSVLAIGKLKRSMLVSP